MESVFQLLRSLAEAPSQITATNDAATILSALALRAQTTLAERKWVPNAALSDRQSLMTAFVTSSPLMYYSKQDLTFKFVDKQPIYVWDNYVLSTMTVANALNGQPVAVCVWIPQKGEAK